MSSMDEKLTESTMPPPASSTDTEREKSWEPARTTPERHIIHSDSELARPPQAHVASQAPPRRSIQFTRRASEPGRENNGEQGRRATFDIGRGRSSADLGRRRSSDNGRRSFAAPRTSLAGPARARTEVNNTLAPPSLDYSLRDRKRSIAFFWSLILIDSIAMPVSLYFGLWYGTNLTPNTVFSIVTAALGGISIFEYVLRFWRLFKKDSTCRVIGGRRSYLDWFHWNFSLSWVIIMVELIVGTIPTNPPIRLLAMPVSSLLFVFGTEMLIQDGMRLLGLPAPFRISSMPAKSQLRPGIYWVIEDVIAVDGSGGVEFRERLNARYEASHDFRQMLHRLTLFWGIGAEAAAVVITILVFTIEHDAAYVVGWAAPFLWAGVWTLITFSWVKRSMRHEEQRWLESQGKEEV